MKRTMILMSIIVLTAKLAATSIAPQASHDVASTNGKFKLLVDAKKETHKITGAFGEGIGAWSFKHEVWNHDFLVSDDGQAAAVVHWAWCKEEDLDEPAVVIYSRTAEKFGAAGVKDGKEILATGFRPGIKRSYTYRQLSKPRVRKPDEVGPIGDFWRVWRGESTIKGNILTINVEGAEPVVIDVVNPPDLPAHQAAKNANDDAKVPQKPGETGQE